MHELLELRQALFSGQAGRRGRRTTSRKLEIIQHNVYGVDIDLFAVNIARLRLWLSLAVEFEGANPPPLPNLDFKIETGDSLTAPVRGVTLDISEGDHVDRLSKSTATLDSLQAESVRRFKELKGQYIDATGNVKKDLRRQIDDVREQLRIWLHSTGAVDGFDWTVEFAEVFDDGGFDVVLANPPYVRQESIKEQKPALLRAFGPLYAGTADLYVYFYYRALELLKRDGAIAFISSNKWFKAAYGTKLRHHFSVNASVLSITDFKDLPVFEGASAYAMIFIGQRGPSESSTVFCEPPNLAGPILTFNLSG